VWPAVTLLLLEKELAPSVKGDKREYKKSVYRQILEKTACSKFSPASIANSR
jgi:hypothetical protein